MPTGDANSKRTDDDGSSRLFSPRSLDVSETEDKKKRPFAMGKCWINENITSDYLSNLGRKMATQNIIINIKKHMNMLQLMLFFWGSERSSFCIIMQPLTKAFGWTKLCNHPWPEWAKHRPRRIDTHHPQLVPCDITDVGCTTKSYFVWSVILLMEEILHRDVSKNL